MDRITGTIDHIKKSAGSYFFILGDDGVKYFTERKHLLSDEVVTNAQLFNKYCYKGNRCTFEVADLGGKSLTAINVMPELVADPLAKEKKKMHEECLRRHEENVKRKAENLEKQRIQMELAAERKAERKRMKEQYERYFVQKRVDGKWDESPCNNKFFMDLGVANLYRDKLKTETGDKYRVVRKRVVKLNGKIVISDVKEW